MQKLLSEKLLSALEFSSVAHADQFRRDGKTPYVSHPFAVAMILVEADAPEDVVIAGALHDVVEDTGRSLDEIRERFGEQVAGLVSGVTEDKNIRDWAARKRAYLDHLKSCGNDVKAVSAADLLANLTDILLALRKGVSVWSSFTAPPDVFLANSRERLAIIGETLDSRAVQEIGDTIQEIEEVNSGATHGA